MMRMSFGKYRDKTVAYILLTDYEYFLWMHNQNMSNKPEYKEALRLLNILDKKPFIVRCYHCKDKIATQFSLYDGGVAEPYFFCDECDPYSMGAMRGKLSSYRSIMNVRCLYKGYLNTLIKMVAQAKGCPKRKTEEALNQYFLNY